MKIKKIKSQTGEQKCAKFNIADAATAVMAHMNDCLDRRSTVGEVSRYVKYK